MTFYDRTYDESYLKTHLASNAWMCSSDYGTVKKDLKAGLNIPLPQNPTVKIGGDFSQGDFEQWQKNYCDGHQLTDDQEKKTWEHHEILSRYMGDAIQAWEKCNDSRTSGGKEYKRQFKVELDKTPEYDTKGVVEIKVNGSRSDSGQIPPSLEIVAQGAKCDLSTISSTNVEKGTSFYCTRTRKTPTCTAEGAIGRYGYDSLYLTVKYRYDGLFQGTNQDAVAVVPEVDASCTCGTKENWTTDFQNDVANCGACGKSCGENSQGYNGRCSQGSCSECDFHLTGRYTKGPKNVANFSCRMKPNMSAQVSVDADFAVSPPATGGNGLNAMMVTGGLTVPGSNVPLNSGQKDKYLAETHFHWAETTPSTIPQSGLFDATFYAGECYFGTDGECTVEGRIVVKEK